MTEVVNTSGKRKTAVARATVKSGKGRVRINKVPLGIHQPELARLKLLAPIILAGEKVEGLDIDVSVAGGGVIGQAEASRTAIARGLVQFLTDDALEEMFKNYDRRLLVNDTRKKLAKKPLGRGARAKRQKSYR